MKPVRIFTLMLIVAAVAMVSCKEGPGKLIAKTWKVNNVVAKGIVNDSIFQLQKVELMKLDMTFKDNKYTMVSNGNIVESGTYTVENDKLVIRTEEGMRMDATVTKELLTLDTPDFTVTLRPK